MTPASLAEAVLAAARSVFAAHGMDPDALPASTPVERPRNPEHGDYATNLALQVSRKIGVPPRELAGWLAAEIAATPGVASTDVAGPGFVNIRLETAAVGELARTVVTAGREYGRSEVFAGSKLNLEFVSANPTGPVHIGAVRWAAVGDALARVLRAAGAEVTTEYYFNDAGSQVTRFARTLYEVALGRPVPADGYHGDYVTEIAEAVLVKRPEIATLPEDQAVELCRIEGVGLMFDEIKSSLAEFGVHFDVYFNEKDLHDRGELQAALRRLQTHGSVYEADGAVWVRTSDYGDDKDRPIRKSDGEWTYFAADCAYYLDKRSRGFDRAVIMLGADHHGYVGRLRAMVSCFGDDPDQTLEILIGQMVNLVRDGQPVRLSKRAGDLVLLADMVTALGTDAARYALARYSADSNIDLDLDLWTRRTQDNPVYYVQYAHARIASLLRNAGELGIERGELDAGLLTHEREGDLVKALGEFPEIVATAAELRQPHRIARYLETLAGTYHRFYDACRVLPMGDESATPLTHARLWLVEATRVVLANGLGMLGVSAPERM